MGVDFADTLMIGRQTFWPDAAALRRVFDVLGVDHDADQFAQQNKYAEPFFSLLGASEISSLDVSAYEKASIIHDMNLPVPPDLRERFSVVHDGGTIEHVFNIPQALKNCMEMVRVGGHFTQVNVANNYMGHGFWQFSPELIFRAFSADNGYQIEAVLLHEVVPGGAWYRVSDPDEIRSRVELCNDQPPYILTIARRIAKTEIFARPPQQSDYVALWDRTLNPPAPTPTPQQSAASATNGNGHTAAATWRSYLPGPLKRSIKSVASVARQLRGEDDTKIKRGFDGCGYRRIAEDDLLRGKLLAAV